MKFMKKTVALLLVAIIAMTVFVGCAKIKWRLWIQLKL